MILIFELENNFIENYFLKMMILSTMQTQTNKTFLGDKFTKLTKTSNQMVIDNSYKICHHQTT